MDHDIENNADELELNAIQALLPKYRTQRAVAFKKSRIPNPKPGHANFHLTKLGSVDVPKDASLEDAQRALSAKFPEADTLRLYDETGSLVVAGTLDHYPSPPQATSESRVPSIYHMETSIKAEVDKLLEDAESKEASVTFTVTGTAANVQRALRKVAGSGKKKPGAGGTFGGKPKDAPIIDDAPAAEGEETEEIIDDEPVGQGGPKFPKAPPFGESTQVHARARGIVNQLIEKKS